MKLLDTNVFVRYIVSPIEGRDSTQVKSASDIFNGALQGVDTFTTTESVVAEVIYVLTSPQLYNLSRAKVREQLERLFSLSGCRIENRRSLITALENWEKNSRLSFVDALCMAQAQQHGHELVTFDTALAKAAGTQRWDLRSTDADHVTNPTVETP